MNQNNYINQNKHFHQISHSPYNIGCHKCQNIGNNCICPCHIHKNKLALQNKKVYMKEN